MKFSQNSVWENNKFSEEKREEMLKIEKNYDVVIIGAGHAGCEAALASARLGLDTIVFTVSVDSIALMPCNPNIGGTSKGHLVRVLFNLKCLTSQRDRLCIHLEHRLINRIILEK